MIEFRGLRIKALREGLGLTLEEFAAKLSENRGNPVRKQQVSIWENGVNKPTMDNLVDICNTFDTEPGFFFEAASTTVEEGSHGSID